MICLPELVTRLVEGYKARGVKTLVCSCPCCVNIMSRDWQIFYGKPLPFRIRHITQLLRMRSQGGKLRFRELKERIIYHDPCYLSRGVGVIEEPRQVLNSIPGAVVLEFERNRLNSRLLRLRRRGTQGFPRKRDRHRQADHRRSRGEEGGPSDPGLPCLLCQGE